MRICIDFIDLNKACKKDPFPLLRIPLIKRRVANDFYSRTISQDITRYGSTRKMRKKTSFTTPFGTYCYIRMPEGIKNAGSTFARMTKAVLGLQLQKNIIAYIDDIVVMSKNEEDHITDLKETFANLREAGLKLNLEKCAFGVSRGKMLGYIKDPKA
jgi:hypothetical protein